MTPDQLTTVSAGGASVPIDMTPFATCGPNTTDPPGAIDCRKVTLKSTATNQYVSAEWDRLDLGRLAAKGQYLTADAFTACYYNPGYYTLFSWANRKYVTAELGDSSGTLQAKASEVGAWEKFTIHSSPSSFFGIQSQANGKYVTSNLLDVLSASIDNPGPRESWDIQSEPRIHPGQPVNYVALGDSYSSGQGAGDYDPASKDCKRSANAYPQRWVKDFSLEPVTKFTFVACANATTADVESEQLNSLGPETTMVTMSIGG
ncbi:hypothetical protein E7Y31_21705, partial [Candidatus Frankia alpina]